MKAKKSKYEFTGELWKYPGPAGWCFVTLPGELTRKIREKHSQSEEGWGRLKATASIGKTSWATAIWFDTKKAAYLLPVKTEIRKKEKLAIGAEVTVKVEVA